MGSFKLGGMTLGSIFKKPETVLYPFEKKEMPKGLKGHIVIDENSCILCGICQKTCSAGAITIDKASRQWVINPFQCVQCSACVYACPKDCLSMDPTYTPVAGKMYTLSFDVPDPKAVKVAVGEEAS